MTPQERRTLLRGWLRQLTIEPIDPGDDRYVALKEAGRGAVDDIYSLIDLSIDTTTQLLSGPRGSGKTTELRRLRQELEESGFTVALVDVLSYVNQSTSVDATEFLIAIALGAGEQLPLASQGADGDRFVRRFRDFLRRVGVSVDLGPAKVDVSAERARVEVPGLAVEVDLKKELKRSEPFVEELRRKLAFHLGALFDEVCAYFDELVVEDKERHPNSRGLVVIVDSLEKVRGTSQNDAEVQASVESLFVHHSDKLRFQSHHTVYTVPPYLLFTDPGALPFDGTVRPVPIPQVHDKRGKRVEATLLQLEDVVARRVDWQALLASRDLLEEVLVASGGHLRDLFRLLQELITLVNARSVNLPAENQHVADAIDKVALGFSQITSQDATFLRAVVAREGSVEPADSDVQRMARLVDTHMLLSHLNGEAWYEVHPLALRHLSA